MTSIRVMDFLGLNVIEVLVCVAVRRPSADPTNGPVLSYNDGTISWWRKANRSVWRVSIVFIRQV